MSGFRGQFFTIVSYWYLQDSGLGGNEQGTFAQAVYCFSATATEAETTAENVNVRNMIKNIKFL